MKHGILSPKASAVDGFHLWMMLCEDTVVRQRSIARAKRHRPHQQPSVHAGYTYAAPVLNAMTAKELQQLKARLGIKPDREYAVVK